MPDNLLGGKSGQVVDDSQTLVLGKWHDLLVLLLMIATLTNRADMRTVEIEATGNAFYDQLLVVDALFKSSGGTATANLKSNTSAPPIPTTISQR